MFRSFMLPSVIIAVASVSVIAAPSATEEEKNESMLPRELRAKAAEAIDRGLVFLSAAQLEDGGWSGFDQSDPAITALVVDCFARHPDYGPEHPLVERAYEMILRFAQPDGGIYIPDRGLMNYYTSVAVMALSRSKSPKAVAAVKKAQKYLTGLQWDESEDYDRSHVFYGGAGYGQHKRPDLSNTQMMLEALHQSGLSPEHPVYKKAIVFITRCQMREESNDQPFAKHGDGGFIYSPANGGESKAGEESVDGFTRLRSYGSMTYSGYKSLLYAGLTASDPRVRAARQWIGRHYTLDRNPNMPDEQAKQGLYYYYHVFARAMAASGRNVVSGHDGSEHHWRVDLCRKLIELQQPDGSWVNSEDRWYESNPQLVTAYSVAALLTALE